MIYLVATHYECVASGSLIPAAEELRTFDSQEEAEVWFSGQWLSVLSSVTDEIGKFKNNPHLEFDSSYIMWVLAFTIPDEYRSNGDAAGILGNVFKDMESLDDPKLRSFVTKYSGYSFDPDPNDFALRDALEYLGDLDA